MNEYHGVSHEQIIEYAKSVLVPEPEAFGFLLNSVKCGRPLSLIRLGDGEAKLLGHPSCVSDDKISKQLEIWFGEKSFDPDDIKFLRRQLFSAIDGCDVIGLPSAERLQKKDDNGNYSSDAINCAILWAEIIEKKGLCYFSNRVVVSANFHHWIQKSKAIKRVLINAKNIALITHRLNLPHSFFTEFKFNSFSYLQVPGETWSRGGEVSIHYPDRFKELSKYLISSSCVNTVFLVGAGLLGKLYAAMIKNSGGICIDMGAVLDGWNGVIPVERGLLKNSEASMTIEYLLS